MSYSDYFAVGSGLETVEVSTNVLGGYSELFIIPAGMKYFTVDNGTTWETLDTDSALNYVYDGNKDTPNGKSILSKYVVTVSDDGDFNSDHSASGQAIFSPGKSDGSAPTAGPLASSGAPYYQMKSLGNLTDEGVTRAVSVEDDAEQKNAKGVVVKTFSGSRSFTITANLLESGNVELENFLNDLGSENYMLIERQVADNATKTASGVGGLWYPLGTVLHYRFFFSGTLRRSGDSVDTYNGATAIPVEFTASLPTIPAGDKITYVQKITVSQS